MMVEAQATSRYIRTSAQKAGLVLDQIRGRDVGARAGDAAVLAQAHRARHREGAAVGDRERAAEGRLRRRRRSAVSSSACWAESGPEHEAHSSGADGPRVSRREAHGASDGRGGRAAGEGAGGREAPAARSGEGSRRRPSNSARAPKARIALWVRKFIRTDSGSASTRPGGRAGSPTRTTRSCCTRT